MANIFYNTKEEKQEKERKGHFLETAAVGVMTFLHHHCDSVPCFKKEKKNPPKLKPTNLGIRMCVFHSLSPRLFRPRSLRGIDK